MQLPNYKQTGTQKIKTAIITLAEDYKLEYYNILKILLCFKRYLTATLLSYINSILQYAVRGS
jgi:hypothetical protein